MDKALANSAIEEFPKYNPSDEIGDGNGQTNKLMLSGQPDEAKDLKVCAVPGKKDTYCIANKYCPDSETDKKTFVSGHDLLYYVDPSNPRGDIPEKPELNNQFKQWEDGVKEWYKNKDNSKHAIVGDVPTEDCKESDFAKFLPSISLSVPAEATSNTVLFSVKAAASLGINKVTFSVNGSEIGSSNSGDASTTYTIPVDKNNSTLTVTVEVTDNNGNKATDSKSLPVHF
jgi:hypothetical protein